MPMVGGGVPLTLTPEQKARAAEKIAREERVRTTVEDALDSNRYLIATWYITEDKRLIYTPFMWNFEDGDMPTAVRHLKDELSGALQRKAAMLANQVEGADAEVVVDARLREENGQPNAD
jgi:hypothetical protein